MKKFFIDTILHFTWLLAIVFALPISAQNSASHPKASDALKLNTVCIDAGHGGRDAGCVSHDRKYYEKNITLSIAKKLGKLINEHYPDVKVVYTRTTDTYVTLNNRAYIANKNNANLFISIHVNSVTSTKPNGFSVHVLGQSRDKNRDLFSYNSDIVKRENSVILLEEDYSTKYQGFDPNDPESFIFFNLMSNAFYEQSLVFASCVHDELAKGPIKGDRGLWQDPFYVLWKTTMPAALIEIGFISNKNDYSVMRSDRGRDEIANSLFNAFSQYKSIYDRSVDIEQKTVEKVKNEEIITSDVYFGVQIMTIGRKLAVNDPAFKGYSHRAVKVNGNYKYIIGASSSAEKAKEFRKKVSAKFPGCFVVKVEGDKVTIVK